MVRTLDADTKASGRASRTVGSASQRAGVQRRSAQRTTAQTAAARKRAGQRTAAQTRAGQRRTAQTATAGRTEQRTAAQTRAGQRRTAQTATAARTGQRTAAQTRAGQRTTAQRPIAAAQAKSGKGVRTADRNIQVGRNDRVADKAVKAEIEPAGRGVRVDVAGYNDAGGEMRVPRTAMSFQTVIGMLALIAIMTVVLVFYITLQSEVTATSQQIAEKEQELTQIKAENDASYNDINDSISLEEVRRRAIQDLGMKYADRDQVVIYSGTEKDSVHQVSSLNNN